MLAKTEYLRLILMKTLGIVKIEALNSVKFGKMSKKIAKMKKRQFKFEANLLI